MWPPLLTVFAGLFLANPRTLGESGINEIQMNSLWQWMCWYARQCQVLQEWSCTHSRRTCCSARPPWCPFPDLNESDGKYQWKVVRQEQKVSVESRQWKATMENTNQAMTALPAPIVLFLCAHLHENNLASHGCKEVAGDRWQVANDNWHGRFHWLT